MSTSFHLLATVSAHGFGHFAQTALVLSELRRQSPEVRITLRTRLPEALVKSRIADDVTVLHEVADFGMEMTSALDVDYPASAQRYREFHRHWAEQVTQEAQRLRALKPDLVLANAPYLTLAGARQANIPAVGLCSLNWADIYQDYFIDTPGARDIHRQIVDAYNAAQIFFKPEPSMAMPDFTNGVSVPPLAQLGTPSRALLNQHWQLDAEEKLVFLVPGGISTDIPVEQWPRIEGVRWITSWAHRSTRRDLLSHADCPLSFTDLLASCDAVVTKPGYGTTTEAVCNGRPVLFVKRGDWAEEPFIVDWLRRHGQALEITREQFFTGDLRASLLQLWALPRPAIPSAQGARSIVEQMQQFF